MHLNDEQVQRYLHGEIAPSEAEAIRNHVEACSDCSQRVRDAEHEEAELLAMLNTLDRPARAVSAATVVTVAARDRFNWGRWAAVVLMGFAAAGVAYALPGSSARDWFDRLISSFTVRQPVITAPKSESPPPAAGIAVHPGENLVVEFVAPQIAGHARVMIVDSGNVIVRAQIGSPAFTSDIDHLLIDNRKSAGDFEILVPRAARRVEIRIGGQRIFLKEGPRVTTDAQQSTADAYVLPLR